MKWVKRIGAAVGALLVLAVLFAVVRFYVLLPNVRAASDVKAPTTPEAIARGRYLANNVVGCVGCHSEFEEAPGEPIKPGTTGGGRDFGPLLGFPGHVRSPNITPDKEHGIGNWTDGEVLRAMREGISRDGRVLFPLMPYRAFGSSLSDDDALALIAYIRTLAPLPNVPGKMEVDFPVSMFVRAAPKPVTASPPPQPKEPLERGKWLLTVASCGECHTPMDKGQPIAGKSFAGGMAFDTPKGRLHAPNITSDKATGIGSYSDEDILRIFNEGVGKSGRPLWVMPWTIYKGMTDEDKRALLTAIRAIPPVSNMVPAATLKP